MTNPSSTPHRESNSDRLRVTAPEVTTAFRALREAVDAHATLDAKQRELCLLSGFAATRNESGFRIHVIRAHEAGATKGEIEQVALLMLGTSLGLAPVVSTIAWIHEELAS